MSAESAFPTRLATSFDHFMAAASAQPPRRQAGGRERSDQPVHEAVDGARHGRQADPAPAAPAHLRRSRPLDGRRQRSRDVVRAGARVRRHELLGADTVLDREDRGRGPCPQVVERPGQVEHLHGEDDEIRSGPRASARARRASDADGHAAVVGLVDDDLVAGSAGDARVDQDHVGARRREQATEERPDGARADHGDAPRRAGRARRRGRAHAGILGRPAASSAAARTAARSSPTLAWTAATTAPSTSGPPDRRTRAAASSPRSSRAVCVASTALPRSTRTRTPGAGVGGLDRRHDRRGVGAQRAVGCPACRLDPHVVARHLAGELDRPGGDLRRVADDDDPDERLHGQILRGVQDRREEHHPVHDVAIPTTHRTLVMRRSVRSENPKSKRIARTPTSAWYVTNDEEGDLEDDHHRVAQPLDDVRVEAQAGRDDEVLGDHVQAEQDDAGRRR